MMPTCGEWQGSRGIQQPDKRIFASQLCGGNLRRTGLVRIYIIGYAKVTGNAKVCGDAKVYGNALVTGNDLVYGEVK